MNGSLIAIMLAGAMLVPAAAAYAANSGPEFTRAGHKLAQCLYTKRREDVVGMLAATSADQAQRLDNILKTSPACSAVTANTREIEGASVTAPTDIFRGMLAEAALSGNKAGALAPVATPASYQRDWFAGTGRNPAVDEMAVCTAETNPAGIRAMLETTPDSAEEMAAAQALGATLGPCLPQGATLKANRQSLRAALAEALYHRATNPVVATK